MVFCKRYVKIKPVQKFKHVHSITGDRNPNIDCYGEGCFSEIEHDIIGSKKYPWKQIKSLNYYTLTDHFIRHILLLLGWTPYAIRTTSILLGMNLTMFWKHSFKI